MAAEEAEALVSFFKLFESMLGLFSDMCTRALDHVVDSSQRVSNLLPSSSLSAYVAKAQQIRTELYLHTSNSTLVLEDALTYCIPACQALIFKEKALGFP